MKLWEIAHSRTGDKGNISNVSLIAYDEKDYAMLCEKVTPEKYKSLRVRVSGFSDYFNNLNSDLQDDMIKRTEKTR